MPTPRGWQTQVIRMRLVGEKCGDCHQVIFPPRDLCPECGTRVIPEGQNLNQMLKEGKIPFSPPGKERGG